jgi:hypothetical protein
VVRARRQAYSIHSALKKLRHGSTRTAPLTQLRRTHLAVGVNSLDPSEARILEPTGARDALLDLGGARSDVTP